MGSSGPPLTFLNVATTDAFQVCVRFRRKSLGTKKVTFKFQEACSVRDIVRECSADIGLNVEEETQLELAVLKAVRAREFYIPSMTELLGAVSGCLPTPHPSLTPDSSTFDGHDNSKAGNNSTTACGSGGRGGMEAWATFYEETTHNNLRADLKAPTVTPRTLPFHMQFTKVMALRRDVVDKVVELESKIESDIRSVHAARLLAVTRLRETQKDDMTSLLHTTTTSSITSHHHSSVGFDPSDPFAASAWDEEPSYQASPEQAEKDRRMVLEKMVSEHVRTMDALAERWDGLLSGRSGYLRGQFRGYIAAIYSTLGDDPSAILPLPPRIMTLPESAALATERSSRRASGSGGAGGLGLLSSEELHALLETTKPSRSSSFSKPSSSSPNTSTVELMGAGMISNEQTQYPTSSHLVAVGAQKKRDIQVTVTQCTFLQHHTYKNPPGYHFSSGSNFHLNADRVHTAAFLYSPHFSASVIIHPAGPGTFGCGLSAGSLLSMIPSAWKQLLLGGLDLHFPPLDEQLHHIVGYISGTPNDGSGDVSGILGGGRGGMGGRKTSKSSEPIIKLQLGDVLVTRHGHLRSSQLLFHVFADSKVSSMVSGLRTAMKGCSRCNITKLSVQLPEESATVAQVESVCKSVKGFLSETAASSSASLDHVEFVGPTPMHVEVCRFVFSPEG